MLQRITRGTSESVLAQFFLLQQEEHIEVTTIPFQKILLSSQPTAKIYLKGTDPSKNFQDFMVQSHPLFHDSILLSLQKMCHEILSSRKAMETSFACCHQAGVTLSGYLSIPTGKEKSSSTSKDKFRGSRSIPSWEFAAVIHPNPCLLFNVTFQAASPREGIQGLVSLLTHKHSGRV